MSNALRSRSRSSGVAPGSVPESEGSSGNAKNAFPKQVR